MTVARSAALRRALATERAYFELGAEIEHLGGADLAWTPGFLHMPAGAVVQNIVPAAIGPDWLSRVERRLIGLGIRLSRIYLDENEANLARLLRSTGYQCREELFFADNLPDPPPLLSFTPVHTDEDWARKLGFHRDVPESPDGHDNAAADLVALERHKCAHGMDCFLAEVDGRIVGSIGAVWGDGTVRIKNVLVHHDHRRQSVATIMLSHLAAAGRARRIGEQCLVALADAEGPKLYRSLGMTQIGSQFEWSKPLGAPPS